MRYVVEVAKQGSFTRAAEVLYISQSALSQQIRKIEDALETPLFIRSTKSLALTEAGQVFVSHAHETLQAAEQLEQAMREFKRQQEIRIVSTPRIEVLHLTRVQEAFSERHPDISFLFKTMEKGDTSTLVNSSDWDIAILQQSLIRPFRDDGRFYKELLFSFEWCLLMAQNHPLAKRESITLKEVGDIPFFVGTERDAHIARRERVLPPTAKIDSTKSSNYGIMAERIRSGKVVGIGIKPVADHYGFCAVPIRPQKMDRIYLVCPASRRDSRLIKELGDLFRLLSYG